MDELHSDRDPLGEFSAILEAVLDAVVVMDAQGVVLGWNGVARDIFGWTSEEAIGLPLVDLIVPEQYRAAHCAGLARHRATGEAHVLGRRIEITALRKSGEEFPIELSITVAAGGRGDVFIGYLRDISERSQAEQATRQQAAILEQLAEGVIVADSAGRLTFVNEAAARLHGVAQLGVGPDQYSDTYHLFTEDGRPYPPAELPLARALRGETVEEARWRVQRPDGTSVLAIGSARPVLDSAGAQVAAVLTVRDDTARDAAEREVRESEARLRALTDNLPGGMVYQISTGPDGSSRRFLFVSQSHERLTGIAAAAVLEDPSLPYQLIHPDDRERLVAAEAESIRGRTPFDAQVRFRRADGEERWCRILSAPREQQDGSLIWDGLQIDITARVEAELALRELNETLEAQVAARSGERERLWNLSQDMLARADLDGMMSAVSPAWTRVLGWSQSELLTRGYASFMHPEDAPPTLEAIGRMAETGQPTRFENRIAARDGSWKHIEWIVAPEPDGANFIAVGRDLSHVKAREAELEAAQEALRQSQKMEAMGSLTGGVAHDFNNLLTPIIGSLDMLVRKGVGSERERRLIDGALQSAERAKTLVQRLLAFARRQPLQPTAVDVARLVEGMTGLISSTLGPTIDVRVDLVEGLPPAKADANQLEMALLNLAVNARDAMPNGGELTIGAKSEDVHGHHRSALKPGQYVMLSVADTGHGMDPATLAQAVEPFFSTKGIGKGTGLGLSMVHGLAAQLGGGLTLDSTPGEGTIIELWLPVSARPIGTEDNMLDPPAAAAGRGTALLVDDEDLVRMSTADMLIDLGFEVVEASSAEEALEMIKAGTKPAILVTDQLMPGMSGADLAREARVLHPALPVLVISGYAEVGAIAPELPRLTKPFRNAELAASLATLLPEASQ